MKVDTGDDLLDAMTNKKLGRRLTKKQSEVLEKAQVRYYTRGLARAKKRAVQVVNLEWYENLGNDAIAERLGITRGALSAFKTKHRDLLNAEYALLEKQLEQDRAVARLKAKDQVVRRLDKALKAVDECLDSSSDAVKEKAAFKILDRIDPVAKKEVDVNIGVFSSKTAGLLQAALPVTVEAESVEILDETD